MLHPHERDRRGPKGKEVQERNGHTDVSPKNVEVTQKKAQQRSKGAFSRKGVGLFEETRGRLPEGKCRSVWKGPSRGKKREKKVPTGSGGTGYMQNCS